MVAENAEKHPELVAKIAAQGHEIALHALKHRDFLKLSLAEQQKILLQARGFWKS